MVFNTMFSGGTQNVKKVNWAKIADFKEKNLILATTK